MTSGLSICFWRRFPGLSSFAAVYKYMEVLQASRWSSTPGRIVVSTAKSRSVRSGGVDSNDTELRNFAKVVYEYKVANRSYRGDRVSIGENLGNFEVAETLARYPVGKDVTVYYNPNRREQSVIERDMPAGIFKGIAIVVLVLVGLILGGIFGFRKLGDLTATLVRNPSEAPFVAACVGFGLLAMLVIFGIQRHAARQRSWPIAPGKVTSSDVHQYEEWSSSDSGSRRLQTMYRADVVYSYEVAGVRYTGDKAKTGGGVSSNIEAIARRTAERFPVGTTLKVHYDPQNPAESALNPGSRWLLLLWLIPAAVFALAYVVGG